MFFVRLDFACLTVLPPFVRISVLNCTDLELLAVAIKH
jgi:hypothetical protein